MTKTLAALHTELAAATSEAERLLLRHTDEQARWRPRGGKGWSIAECIDHLSATHRLYCDAIAAAIAHSPRGAATTTAVSPGWLSGLFVKAVEPPAKLRVSAKAALMPQSTRSRDEVWRIFQESQSQIAHLIDQCASVDANRIRFASPIEKRMKFTAGTGLMIMLAHLRRHLWQATRVTQQPDFPAAR